LCDACLADSKANSVVRTRVCTACGADFPGGPRAAFCPTCRAERKRQRERTYKRHPSGRHLGSIDLCTVCGSEYVVKGGLQKYCPACAEKAVKTAVSAQKATIPKDTVAHYHAARKGRLKPCAACGKPFHAHLPTSYCSDTCAAYGRYKAFATADYKRGRRHTPPKSFTDWLSSRSG